MKLMLCSDWHLRYRGPSSRTDDVFKTQLGKINWVINVFHDYKCRMILQAGDLFDSPRPPNILLSSYIKVLRQRLEGCPIHCVLGQHDLLMHNLASVSRSAIDVLRSAGVLVLLGADPIMVEDLLIYGASFGESVPSPRQGMRSILVTHRMIGSEPLFPGHDLLKPKAFAHNHKGFELILCGDYHYPFDQVAGSTRIVNAGCLVRQTCGERDLQLRPSVGVYDTQTKELEWISVPIVPSEEVFDLTKRDITKQRESVAAFVDRLRSQVGATVSFRDNLVRYYETSNTPETVVNEISRAFEEVGQ